MVKSAGQATAAAFALFIALTTSVAASATDADPETVKVVTFGSTIKLEHVASKHRLHSHDIPYGTGSGQQSVTAFPDAGDANSYWIVKSAHQAAPKLAGTPVKCGDTIRLQHLATSRNLHTHLQQAPLNRDYEVSAYALTTSGRWAEGDDSDDWFLECPSRSDGNWVRFENVRLRHVYTKMYLTSTESLKYTNPIPGQLQVSSANRKDANSLWKTNEGFYLAPPRSGSS